MTFQYCFDGSIKKVNNLSVSSPRTWGCFHVKHEGPLLVRVFPTHVGVFLGRHTNRMNGESLPHARGGVSASKRGPGDTPGSSPRTWGCFWSETHISLRDVVFPTHVGVFLRNALKRFQAFRSSPRTWGCFPCALRFISRRPVFPTHVGVFLSERFRGQVRKRLPHARGGVSDTGHVTPFSSRVFPTHVGVFLLPHTRCACSVRLPHARGGVSPT